MGKTQGVSKAANPAINDKIKKPIQEFLRGSSRIRLGSNTGPLFDDDSCLIVGGGVAAFVVSTLGLCTILDSSFLVSSFGALIFSTAFPVTFILSNKRSPENNTHCPFASEHT